MDKETELGIEWDVQKTLRQYYHYVDQREYEKAAALFTPDLDWEVMGLRVESLEAMLDALQNSLGSDTIRHILTNAIVTVIDEDHASATTYCTFYYTAGVRIEDQDDPLEFEGPHRTSDGYVELVRTPDGWKIAKRRSQLIFRRNPGEPVTLEKWSKAANKTA